MKVFRAVLEDKTLREFGHTDFQRMGTPMLIWNDAPISIQSCMTDEFHFRIERLSPLGVGSDEVVLAVRKMYYDEDAAFVELDFWRPGNWMSDRGSGKAGDFFLRNENGWKVEQKALGER